MNLEALGKARYIGVRHHSPRATAALREFLDTTRPEAVLVEGPEDATPLIEILVDPETRPPVAILGYRTVGSRQSTLWPFATYSPEYEAVRWAHEHRRHASFIDLPVSRTLPYCDDDLPVHENDSSSPYLDLATDQGYRSFEEWWEARFEAPAHSPEHFARVIEAFATWSRGLRSDTIDRTRNAWMARAVSDTIESRGIPPERVAVVMGAAHVSAFLAGDLHPEAVNEAPDPVESEVTLIPFSYPRLAEQLGYGAGNRAPLYYQRAHEAGCDYRRASLEALLDIAQNLRLRGFAVSLADTIEAYRLALRLSEMRDKPQPGLDEVREAAIATMFRGETALVDQMLWSTAVGSHVGRVASRIGRNSLQQEFWHEVRSRRLPQQDTPESFTLHLHNEVEIGTSVFLHRLRIADIPYAIFIGSRTSFGGTNEAAGGVEALRRVRENWEAQWTPSTDVALAERIALGDSLRQVATRRLTERLGSATSTGAAADVLLESVVADCPATATSALEACDRFAATDDDLPSLARACQSLSGLASFGTSRAIGSGGDEAVSQLCVKTFDRGILRVAGACQVDDSAVDPIKAALHAMHEVATSQQLVDREAWFAAARGVVDSFAVNPALSGVLTGLLYLAQQIEDEALALILEQRLSETGHPERAAGFLQGFLEVNALVLVRNRRLVQILDAFLAALPADAFRGDLPVLRRAFASLGATERRYLLENLLAIRQISQSATAVKEIMAISDEALEKIDSEVSSALDDLDDLL
jgi:hypothetical protein